MRWMGMAAALTVAAAAFATEGLTGKLELQEGWEAKGGSSAPTWTITNDTCVLTGQLKSEAAYPGTTIAYLPTACKPPHSQQFTAKGDTATIKVDVAKSGEMVLASGSAAEWITLDGAVISLTAPAE